jgi:hypothetical protein
LLLILGLIATVHFAVEMALLVEGLDVGKDTRTQLLLTKGWLQIQRRSNYTDLNKAKPGG